MDCCSINISWSQVPPVAAAANVMQRFSLMVSHGSHTETISLSESYYHFTAPEGAPPCEVYNFFVTATYVGATYTGADCSVPSPVLSKVLPSLPDIDVLESSLNYSLIKKSDREVFLQTSFLVSYFIHYLLLHDLTCPCVWVQQANYCEEYPINNYTLIVSGSSFESEVRVFMPAETTISLTSKDLLDNALLTFNILASNRVGEVGTNEMDFCKFIYNYTVCVFPLW